MQTDIDRSPNLDTVGLRFSRRLRPLWVLWIILLSGLAACSGRAPVAGPSPLGKEITYYDWEGDMPQSVIDRFAQEFGGKINYLTYESLAEAIRKLEDGLVVDVVNMESQLIPRLRQRHLLAEIDKAAVPNFKYVSENFRDLTYDPNNRYSIPNSWGATGILLQSDRVAVPVTRWSDLWDPSFAGKVGMWRSEDRNTIGMTLHSLGYSANSEDPRELQAAEDRLMALKPSVVFMDDYESVTSAPLFADGKVVVALGWGWDHHAAQPENPALAFVYPEDGALLTATNYIIPASSTNQHEAATFINFLTRPDIVAMMVNELYYAAPIEGVQPLVEPEIRANSVLFPTNQELENAEVILPLSPEGEKRYAEIWARFIR